MGDFPTSLIRNRNTCLSPPVQKLFDASLTSQRVDAFLNGGDEFCLDWTKFATLLRTEDFCDINDVAYWADTIPKLAPLINDASERCKDDYESALKSAKNLEWLGALREEFLQAANLLITGDFAKISLATLIITAILERCLGSLLLLKRSFVPPLLKDLLAVPETSDLIGTTTVRCLQAIIGPPSSLNIRNLLWHGFLFPGEISPRFALFLVVIMRNIGQKLSRDGIDCESLPERPLTIYKDDRRIQDTFPELDEQDLQVFHQTVQNSSIVFPKSLPLWNLALQLFQEQQYGFSTVLVMVQLETSLRLVYASVNDMEERILSAQSSELYTTFSEILSEHLVDSTIKNKFITSFSLSHIELLMDILFCPEGLRLRDRMSHGQVDLINFPKSIANHILCTTFVVLKWVDQTFAKELEITERLRVVADAGYQYRSKFHINSDLKVVLGKCTCILRKWITLFYFDSDNKLLRIEDLEHQITQIEVRTLFRQSQELPFVILLRQIARMALSCTLGIFSTLQDKSQLLERRELRSRQRDNLNKLKELQPQFLNSLICCIKLITSLFSAALKDQISFDDSSLVKKLKIVLQCFQNFDSAIGENRWEDSVKFCKKSDDVIVSISKTLEIK